ncbi:MAG: ATP-binding protein [Bacteroidota bacterium]
MKNKADETKHVQDVFELLEYMYNLGIERKEKTITTAELLDKFNEIISINHFPFVGKVIEIGLGAEDNFMLCYLFWKYLNGIYSVDLETAVNGIFDTVHKRFAYRKEILQNSHPLIDKGLVMLELKTPLSDTTLRLENKTLQLLTTRDLEPFIMIKKKDNVILPSDIHQKKLVFNSLETDHLRKLNHAFQDENFHAIQNRLVQKGLPTGFTVLFYGDPGTGKTESVYQLARQTSREIMQVNLSESKTKWFGESERMAGKIFTDYYSYSKDCRMQPILLVNEADGLFSRRKEAGASSVDQTENTIQNIFLQALETFSGILIATTNMAGNFDYAFERRFLYKIKFTKPDLTGRAQIWKIKLPILNRKEHAWLAEEYDFTGAQIDNIIRKLEITSILEGGTPTFSQVLSSCNEELIEKAHYRKIGFRA